MPKLFIPPLGSELILAAPWSFNLYHEDRNELAFIYFDQKMKAQISRWEIQHGRKKDHDPIRVCLAKGIRVKVDRIYIRKGFDDFDSITFTLPEIKRAAPFSRAQRAVRFWVKLEDANTLEFEA